MGSIKKAARKNFAIFTGKTCVRACFLVKLQAFRPATLLKRDSNTGVFLRILRNSKNTNCEEHLRTAALKKV